MDFIVLRPSEGKVFTNADETEIYHALILAPNDSIDNYHEIDEEDYEEPPIDEPDPEDIDPAIPEDEPAEELMSRSELTARVKELED